MLPSDVLGCVAVVCATVGKEGDAVVVVDVVGIVVWTAVVVLVVGVVVVAVVDIVCFLIRLISSTLKCPVRSTIRLNRCLQRICCDVIA